MGPSFNTPLESDAFYKQYTRASRNAAKHTVPKAGRQDSGERRGLAHRERRGSAASRRRCRVRRALARRILIAQASSDTM